MSARAALANELTARPATAAEPLGTIDVPARDPDLPLWPPARLTPELMAAYKRRSHRLRSEAVADMVGRAGRWLFRHGSRRRC